MIYLVVAAHPDDEVLGCGGTMAKLSSLGHEVNVLILAEGITSRADKRDFVSNKDLLAELYKSSEKSAKILGLNSLEMKKFPDNRMDSIDLLDIIKEIAITIF